MYNFYFPYTAFRQDEVNEDDPQTLIDTDNYPFISFNKSPKRFFQNSAWPDWPGYKICSEKPEKYFYYINLFLYIKI